MTHIRLVTVKMFHRKHAQTVIIIALFYYFSMAPSKGFRLPPICHVHVLLETVNWVKQVTEVSDLTI